MNQENSYDLAFFKNLEISVLRSSQILVPLICKMYLPKSVLDIGCGNGLWLRAFEENGIKDYAGIDGDYVTKDIFAANFDKFTPADLEQPIDLNKKFDLAISLEVGEHLKPENATNFIKTLCSHSDLIVFSAAIPNQKGTNHINEQWQSYWADIFVKYGYTAVDEIRPVIWLNNKISYWYRQNIIVYKKSTEIDKNTKKLNRLHPELEFIFTGKTNVFQQLLSNPFYVIGRFLKKYNIL